MSKQTATQYLIEEIKSDSFVQAKSTKEWNEVFRIAKEMEREQIEDAFKHGQNNGFMYRERGFDTISSNQFYKQIYGGQDEM